MFRKVKKVTILLVFIFFALVFVASSAFADRGIVLALSGGGAKGLAHIGVIKALEEEGVKIVGIVGTSMGAIVGGLAASGYDGAEIERIFRELDLYELFWDGKDGNSPSSMERPIIRLSYDEENRIMGRMGIIEGRDLYGEMLKYVSCVKTYDFMKFPIPFAAVATDLETGEMVVITKGNLASAMRASMALPGIFSPWLYNGKLLIDGGLVANLPVRVAKNIFPGYPVLAIDVTGKLVKKEEIRSMIDVLGQTVGIMTAKNVEEDLQYADAIVRPAVDDISLMDFSNIDELIERGARATFEQMDQIKALVVKVVDDEQPLKNPIVKDVRLTGIPDIQKSFTRERRSWISRPLDMKEVNNTLLELLEHDRVAMADYKLIEEDGKVIVEYVVKRKPQKEYAFSGYSTNISSDNRWATLKYMQRDLWDLGDEAHLQFWLGENFFARASYVGSEGSNWRFESSLAFQDWEITPENYGKVNWKRYFAYLGFDNVGEDYMSFSGGIAFDHVDDGKDEHHWGPMVKFSYKNKKDDKSAGYFETEGLFWYPEGETLLGRVVFASSLPLSDEWRATISGGVEKGDASTPAWAAYLGGYGEMLGRLGHPVMAENAAWTRVSVQNTFAKGLWGKLEPEFFGAIGYALDDDWRRIQELWEVGIGLNIPNRIIDLSVFALYDDRSDWTFGFSVGTPPVSYGPVMP